VSETQRIRILVYDFSWGRTLIRASKSGPGYEIILPSGRFEDADVVVFHIPTAPDLTHLKKRPGQIWVAWSYESDRFYPQQCDPEYMRQFDLTMTYHWDSDIPVAYFDTGIRDDLFQPPIPKTADAPAVSFVSNVFDLCGRYNYLKELMQLLPVDSCGLTLRNKELAEDKRRETKLETIANYKFTLAFENSISRDYVTEKFFDPLIVGSVPVYRGAPNIEEFAPGDHCCIDAGKFKGPRELAEYLLFLAGNQTEYERYLAWKEKPFRQSFLDRVEILADDPFLRLYERVRQLRAADSGHVSLVPRLSSTASAVVKTVQRRLGMPR